MDQPELHQQPDPADLPLLLLIALENEGEAWATDEINRRFAITDAVSTTGDEATPARHQEQDPHDEIRRRARLDYATARHARTLAALTEARLAAYEALTEGRPTADWRDADLLPEDHPLAPKEYEGMARPTEYRTISAPDFEIRDDGDGLRFSGYAAHFDTPSAPLPFIETIAPGAFARALGRAATGGIIKLFHAHDPSQMLAATPTSLRLVEDEKGLRVDADLVDSPIGQHVAALVRRDPQAVSMSFGFRVPKGGEAWEGNTRRLLNVDLSEVSILTGQSPAYATTTGVASVRSLESVAAKLGVSAETVATALGAAAQGNTLDAEDAELVKRAAAALIDESRYDAAAEHASEGAAILAEIMKLVSCEAGEPDQVSLLQSAADAITAWLAAERGEVGAVVGDEAPAPMAEMESDAAETDAAPVRDEDGTRAITDEAPAATLALLASIRARPRLTK